MNYNSKNKIKNQETKIDILEKCTDKRLKNPKFSDYIKSLTTKKNVERIKDCGTFLELLGDLEMENKKINKANFCGNRFTQKYGKLPVGYDHKYVYSHFGYNLKATDMQAAVGCAQIDKFPSFVEKRKKNFNRIKDGLQGLEDKLILPEAEPNSDPSWFGFLITTKENNRNRIVQYLEDNNIQTRMLFAGNIIKHPCFDQIRDSNKYRVVGDLENTDKIMNNTFWIGVYPGMTNEKIDYMIEKIREAVE